MSELATFYLELMLSRRISMTECQDLINHTKYPSSTRVILNDLKDLCDRNVIANTTYRYWKESLTQLTSF